MTHAMARRGLTLIEILTVIGIIVILLAILLPALSAARSNSVWANAQNNMRQIYTVMQSYSTDNRETIVPSQFDYTANPYPGKVRTPAPAGSALTTGDENMGTWTDILWTHAEFGPIPVGPTNDPNYRYDSPDDVYYGTYGEDTPNIFRSPAVNTRNATDGTGDGLALPYGTGAESQGSLGYFAANDFFNARPDAPNGGSWWTTAQIKQPTNSVFAVDSFYGEIIPDTEAAWESAADSGTGQVDFRYNGDTALMLMMDGRIETEPRWGDLADLLDDRQIRVQNLNQ